MEVRFWVDGRGQASVERYLAELDRHGEAVSRLAIERALRLLVADGPLPGMPLTRIIDRRERLYELRVGSHRLAYSVSDGVIVLLHAWRKRGQKLDTVEAATALRRLKG